ncbi:MAG: cytochrome c biogenesis protein CcsA [Candidatus Cryptobacteroides sp.]
MGTGLIRKTPFLLLALLVVLLVGASVAGALGGNDVASRFFYRAPYTVILWGAVAVSAFCLIAFSRLKLPALLIHIAFGLILAGAATTFVTGLHGTIHLREGESTDILITVNGPEKLPFSIGLKEFNVEYYEGTESPRDYISTMIAEGAAEARISMNKVLKYKGYRFCQAGYDNDGCGATYSVSRDVAGIALTYSGYILLLIGFLSFFFQKDSGFRRHLAALSKLTVLVVLLVAGTGPAKAQEIDPELVEEPVREVITIPEAEAGNAGRIYVMHGGRVCPFGEMAGKNALRDGKVSLETLWKIAYNGESPSEMETILFESNLARIVQSAENQDWDSFNMAVDRLVEYQEAKIFASRRGRKADTGRLYEATDFNLAVALLCLLAGLLGIYCSIVGKLQGRLPGVGLGIVQIAALIYLIFRFVLGWRMAGFIPLTDGCGTMQFLALCSCSCSLLALTVGRGGTGRLLSSSLLLLVGAALLVAMMSNAGVNAGKPAPVLDSPLLCVHVMLVMVAYMLFGLMAVGGAIALILNAKSERKSGLVVERLWHIDSVILYFAVFLLAAGIFTGAVWANMSWGRYWGWDPKETWALITLLVYSFGLHQASLEKMRRPMFFHVFTLLAFACVLMTYFGVNYLLGGLHSYA